MLGGGVGVVLAHGAMQRECRLLPDPPWAHCHWGCANCWQQEAPTHQGAGGARLAGVGTAGPTEPLRPGDPAPPVGSAPCGTRLRHKPSARPVLNRARPVLGRSGGWCAARLPSGGGSRSFGVFSSPQPRGLSSPSMSGHFVGLHGVLQGSCLPVRQEEFHQRRAWGARTPLRFSSHLWEQLPLQQGTKPGLGPLRGPGTKLGSPRWIRARAGLGGAREGMAGCSHGG